MFSIDLLKGKGIPIKSKPGVAALLSLTIAIPLVIIMLMIGNYARGTIILSMGKKQLSRLETNISNLAEFAESRKAQQNEITNLKACLVEVGENINKNIQWSPILEFLANNLPHRFVLTELNVRSDEVRKLVPSKTDKSKSTVAFVVRKTLYISLYGMLGNDNDRTVLKFLQKLNNSTNFSSKVISQTSDDDQENTMHYVIECVFKT